MYLLICILAHFQKQITSGISE